MASDREVEPLRVAVVGAGGWGAQHARVFSERVDTELVAVVGRDTAGVWRPGHFDDEAGSFERTFDRHVDAVLAALRTGSPPPVPASAGRRALELAHAVIRPHESGARVATRRCDTVRFGPARAPRRTGNAEPHGASPL